MGLYNIFREVENNCAQINLHPSTNNFKITNAELYKFNFSEEISYIISYLYIPENVGLEIKRGVKSRGSPLLKLLFLGALRGFKPVTLRFIIHIFRERGERRKEEV